MPRLRALDRLLPDPPRRFRTTIISSAGSDTGDVIERIIEAGATAESTRKLGIAYPPKLLSASSNPFFPYMLGRIEEGMSSVRRDVPRGPQ